MTENVVALDVGGTSIKGVRYGVGDREQVRRDVTTPAGGAAVVAAIADLAAGLRDEHTLALGVVVPGAVDAAAGMARYSAHLGWRDVPLRAQLNDRLGLPVAIEHDVAAAAIAEARGHDGDLLLVALGTGIGSGHVVAGSVWRGATGRAGELGHVTVQPDGPLCDCGQRGCLELYSSGSGLVRRFRAQGGRADLDAAGIAARLDRDPIAAAVWTDLVDALALALAGAVQLLDPSVVVLGGGLAAAGDRLLEPLRTALALRLVWRPPPDVRVAALGRDAGRLGAAELAWRLVSRSDDDHG